VFYTHAQCQQGKEVEHASISNFKSNASEH